MEIVTTANQDPLLCEWKWEGGGYGVAVIALHRTLHRILRCTVYMCGPSRLCLNKDRPSPGVMSSRWGVEGVLWGQSTRITAPSVCWIVGSSPRSLE